MKFTKDEIRQAMELYAITDTRWLKPGERLPEVCRALMEHGITCLQMREKERQGEDLLADAVALRALCEDYGIPFIINDDVALAVEVDADGVHLGQSDIQKLEGELRIPENMLLGISAGTVDEAVEAERFGAHYIGVGAVFSTATKNDARGISSAQLQEISQSVTIPVVAIGGITAENVMALQHSGIDGIAVISALFGAKDPGKAAEILRRKSREVIG